MKDWINNHPNLSAWAVLATGMVAILVYEARQVENLQPLQWFWLIAITVAVAGLCIWIIGWADEEDDTADTNTADDTAATTSQSADDE